MQPFVTSTQIRQGGSYARGTTIDGYLSEEVNQALYDVWAEHKDWPEPLEFPGNVFAITCEMVQEITKDADAREAFTSFFRKHNKKFGEAFAKTILDVTARNAGR